MRIGYDGKRAANNQTGLGNYSRSLIEHLAQQFPENQYFVYTPKIKEKLHKLLLFSSSNVHLELPQKGSSKLFWRSSGIKKQLVKDQLDLFHGLSHEIPFGLPKTGIKSIVTMHDLIFLRLPQYYKFIDRQLYRFKSQYACKHANRIIAISEKTKQDIVELYQISPNRIDVVYQSCDDSFKVAVNDDLKAEVTQTYQLPEKYILNVGTIEGRKNLLQLVRALPTVNPIYKLVVIGRPTAYAKLVEQEISKLGLTERVIFLKNVPFSHLPAIYRLASLFVLPSYYEGFGIPIIEALYSQVPVIAATGSCLEEAGGPFSKYVSPDDVNALAKAINQVLADEKLQADMKTKGLQYVQRFNNDIVNEQLMNCYLKTLAP